jgi:hypothetical protein
LRKEYWTKKAEADLGFLICHHRLFGEEESEEVMMKRALIPH